MSFQTIRVASLQVCMMVVGAALISWNYYIFMKPNDIVPPGIGGLVALFSIWANQPMSLVNAVANLPIFLMGWYFVGRRFLLLSMVGAACMSLFLQLFSEMNGPQILWLGTVISGFINGLAVALVLYFHGATGGMEIVCVVLARFYPKFGVGKFMYFLNIFIVAMAGWALGWISLCSSVVSIYLAGVTVDFILARTQTVQLSALGT